MLSNVNPYADESAYHQAMLELKRANEIYDEIYRLHQRYVQPMGMGYARRIEKPLHVTSRISALQKERGKHRARWKALMKKAGPWQESTSSNPLTRRETADLVRVARRDYATARRLPSASKGRVYYIGSGDGLKYAAMRHGQLKRVGRRLTFTNPLTRRETAGVLRQAAHWRRMATRDARRIKGIPLETVYDDPVLRDRVRNKSYAQGRAAQAIEIAGEYGQMKWRHPERFDRNPLTRRETADILREVRSSLRHGRVHGQGKMVKKITAAGGLAYLDVADRYGSARQSTIRKAAQALSALYGKELKYKKHPKESAFFHNPRIGTDYRNQLFFSSKSAATAYARSRGWNVQPRYVPLRVPRGKV